MTHGVCSRNWMPRWIQISLSTLKSKFIAVYFWNIAAEVVLEDFGTEHFALDWVRIFGKCVCVYMCVYIYKIWLEKISDFVSKLQLFSQASYQSQYLIFLMLLTLTCWDDSALYCSKFSWELQYVKSVAPQSLLLFYLFGFVAVNL